MVQVSHTGVHAPDNQQAEDRHPYKEQGAREKPEEQLSMDARVSAGDCIDHGTERAGQTGQPRLELRHVSMGPNVRARPHIRCSGTKVCAR
jgi:hypothetical protein